MCFLFVRWVSLKLCLLPSVLPLCPFARCSMTLHTLGEGFSFKFYYTNISCYFLKFIYILFCFMYTGEMLCYLPFLRVSLFRLQDSTRTLTQHITLSFHFIFYIQLSQIQQIQARKAIGMKLERKEKRRKTILRNYVSEIINRWASAISWKIFWNVIVTFSPFCGDNTSRTCSLFYVAKH